MPAALPMRILGGYAILCTLLACQEHAPPKSESKANSVSAVGASGDYAGRTAQTMQLKVRGTCTLKPERVVRLKSQIGGEVKSVAVQQGEKVRRGDILATIDVENLNLRRERTVIELERLVQRAELLRFQVAKAEKEFAIIKEIAGGSATNYARYGKEMASIMERRAELKDNELNQSLSKLDLKVLDDQIRKAAIRAPLDGVILLRAVEPGAVVGSGAESVAGSEVLFEVADPAKLVATCIIKEADAALLVSGRATEIIVDGNEGKPIPGKVGRIAPVIANEGGLARREFLVELTQQSAIHLLPGMNATVELDSR